MSEWPRDLPLLPTFSMHPSWCNNRGHVDRSACVEVRASWVGRQEVVWRRARSAGGRREVGWAVIDHRDVDALMRRRFSRRLTGDYRTHARAMRPIDRRNGEPFDRRRQVIRDLGLHSDGPDRGCPSNPNRGACRDKLLGLAGGWSQAIAVERWLNHKVSEGERWFRGKGQAAHKSFEICRWYLVCPGCGIGASAVRTGQPGLTQASPDCGPASEVARVRAVDLEERRRRKWSLVNPLYPEKGRWCQPCRGPVTRRCMMLMMPLATVGEVRDARFAQAWLARRRPGSPGTEFECRLIERYGVLFGPRTFRCRHCLGVRYGSLNVKDMPAWRKRWFGGGVEWETVDEAIPFSADSEAGVEEAVEVSWEARLDALMIAMERNREAVRLFGGGKPDEEAQRTLLNGE